MIIKSGLALDSNGLLIGTNKLYTSNDQRLIARPYLDDSGRFRLRSRGEAGDPTNYKYFPYRASAGSGSGLAELVTQVGSALCTVTLRRTCLDPICGDPQDPDCCGNLTIILDPPDLFGQTELTCSNSLIYPKGTAISTAVAPEIAICSPWTHSFFRAEVNKSCQLGTTYHPNNEFTFYTPGADDCEPGDVCSAEIDLIYKSDIGCPQICEHPDCAQAPVYIQGTGTSGFHQNYPDWCSDYVADLKAAVAIAGGWGVWCDYNTASCSWGGDTGDGILVGFTHGVDLYGWFGGSANFDVYWPCGPAGTNRVGVVFGVSGGCSVWGDCGPCYCINPPGGGWDLSWGANFVTQGIVDVGAATSKAQACMRARQAMGGTYSLTQYGKTFGISVQV